MNEKPRTIALFAIAAIFTSIVGYMYVLNKGFFNNSIKLYAFIDDSSGISTTSPVQINGFKIGEVSDKIALDEKVVLTLSINSEINISQNSQLYSVPTNIFGNKHIEIQFSDQGSTTYKNGDTIKTIVLDKNLKQTFDPNGENESRLKKMSKTIGTALIDYAESPIERCNADQLGYVLNRVEKFPKELNEKDAFILFENHCKHNAEYSQIQNELVFKLLEIDPQLFINIINQGNLNQSLMDEFLNRVESPIHDGFDLDKIIQKIGNFEKSEGTQKLIKSLNIALSKY